MFDAGMPQEELERLRQIHQADQLRAARLSQDEALSSGDYISFGGLATYSPKGWTRIGMEEIGKIIWQADQARRDFTIEEKMQVTIILRNLLNRIEGGQ